MGTRGWMLLVRVMGHCPPKMHRTSGLTEGIWMGRECLLYPWDCRFQAGGTTHAAPE